MKLIILIVFSTLLHAQMTLRTQLVMATLVSINIEEKNSHLIKDAFEIIKKVDNSLSSYKENSIISKLNKIKVVKLDSLSFEALSLSKEYYKKSDGYFNIAIGSITKDLYRFGEENNSIPSEYELHSSKVNFKALSFDENEARLDEGIKVDLGGMGKGFGVDKISEYLISNGVKEAVVSASGDIRCLNICNISIKNPFSDSLMLELKTKKTNLGITTSGNYNRYIKNKKYNHLINPKTKYSGENFASITLVGDIKSSALDAYATAASVMPKTKAYEFLDLLGIGYIVIEVGSKTVVKPTGFFDLVSNLK